MVENEESREKGRAQNVKATLESKFIQSIIGGNTVKSNPFLYGELGLSGAEQGYSNAMDGEDANGMRSELHKARQKERDNLGIAEEAPYPTNYDIMVQIKNQLREVQAIATLGELEEHALAVGAKLDFKVPEELKKYSQAELFAKINDGTGRIDPNKLKGPERDAIQMQQILAQAYERALGLKSMQSSYFEDLSSAGKEIIGKYTSKED